MGYIARVVLPIAACTAVSAPVLLSGLYGDRWLGAALPLRLLSAGLALLGLRLAIGSIYYAKDHPSYDIALHGARLALIVAAIFSFAGAGLVGVSAAMSAVEGIVSIAGQVLLCRLIGLAPMSIVKAALPGSRLALACALGSAAGMLIVSIANIQGALALPFILIPPGVVFCWLEIATVRDALGLALRPRPAALASGAVQERV